MSESFPPRGAKKTYGDPSSRGRPSSNATASGDSGTRCDLPFFMRAAGIVQTAAFVADVAGSRLSILLAGLRSISPHVAPRTSPERAAVSVKNSRARAAIPSRWDRSRHQRDTSTKARAGWLPPRAILAGLGSASERLPFQRAGLSPVLCPATVAQDRTFSILPRRRDAVSVLSRHIGSSVRNTSCTVMSATSLLPSTGVA